MRTREKGTSHLMHPVVTAALPGSMGRGQPRRPPAEVGKKTRPICTVGIGSATAVGEAVPFAETDEPRDSHTEGSKLIKRKPHTVY